MLENKLKDAAEKITMSGELKDRIADKCRNIELPKAQNETEHVFTVEQYQPRRPIIRIISGIAACAVLIGAVGTAGHLLSRNGAGNLSSTDMEQLSESDDPETENMSLSSPPFGDLRERRFDLFREAADSSAYLDAKSIDRIAVLFDEITWEPVEIDNPDADRQTKVSIIFRDTVDYPTGKSEQVFVLEDDLLCYITWNREYTNDEEENSIENKMTECTYYRIDSNYILNSIYAITDEPLEDFQYPPMDAELIENADMEQLIADCRFGDITKSNCYLDLSDEQKIRLLSLFNNAMLTRVNASESIVSYGGLIQKASIITEDNCRILSIYDDGYICESLPVPDVEETVCNVYRITYADEFIRAYYEIILGDGDMNDDAPFANADFFEIDSITHTDCELYLKHDNYSELNHALRSTYWVKSDYETCNELENIPGEERILTITGKDGALTVSCGKNYAIYKTENETKYYTLNAAELENKIFNHLIYGVETYPRIGSIHKHSDTLECESEFYTGTLTYDQIWNVSLSFYSKNWSDHEIANSPLYESGQQTDIKFRFTSPIDGKNHEESYIVYGDGTVEFMTARYQEDGTRTCSVDRYHNIETADGRDLMTDLAYAVTH